MAVERFIEVKAEIRVTIDKRIVEELGIPEEEIRQLVKSRVESLAHRISMWLTETITSSLLLHKRAGTLAKEKEEQPDYVKVVEKNGGLYLVPNETYRRYSKAKRYLLYNGRYIPIDMNVRRRIVNKEAEEVLMDAMKKRGQISLRIVEANNNRVIMAIAESEVAEDAEDKNRDV